MAIELQQSCINACLANARACEQCQHACLETADVGKHAKTICITRDCADICVLLARFLARQTEYWREACITCSQLCEICADECGKHDGAACQECARQCQQTQELCLAMLGQMIV